MPYLNCYSLTARVYACVLEARACNPNALHSISVCFFFRPPLNELCSSFTTIGTSNLCTTRYVPYRLAKAGWLARMMQALLHEPDLCKTDMWETCSVQFTSEKSKNVTPKLLYFCHSGGISMELTPSITRKSSTKCRAFISARVNSSPQWYLTPFLLHMQILVSHAT